MEGATTGGGGGDFFGRMGEDFSATTSAFGPSFFGSTLDSTFGSTFGSTFFFSAATEATKAFFAVRAWTEEA